MENFIFCTVISRNTNNDINIYFLLDQVIIGDFL